MSNRRAVLPTRAYSHDRGGANEESYATSATFFCFTTKAANYDAIFSSSGDRYAKKV